MERLSEIRARLESLHDLLEVVGAMRSLAAVRVQQARAALPGIRKYVDVIDEALSAALGLAPPADDSAPVASAGAALVIVLSAEHGFVGAFNERILDRAAAELSCPADRLLIIGSRGAALAAERGLPVAWTTPMATHGDAVVETARRVAHEVYARAARGAIARACIIYARSSGGAASEVTASALLPFDPTPYPTPEGPPPATNLAPGALLDALVDELVFAELMRAAMESFASENGARLATMESAHANIEDKIEELSAEERQTRQDQITMELLDVITGARATAEGD